MRVPNFYRVKLVRTRPSVMLTALLFSFVFVGWLIYTTSTSNAANIVWDGGGATNNWNEGDNWVGDSAPGSGDVAVFDGTSTKDATINVAIDVQGIDIQSGYTGTITQSAAVTLGSSGFGMADASAAFTGGSQTIDLNGPFTMSAGSFTNTTGTMTSNDDWTVSGGTFAHNSGEIEFDISSNSNIDVDTSITFYDVILDGTSNFRTFTIASGDTIVISNTYEQQDGYFTGSNGTLEFSGPTVTIDGGSSGIATFNATGATTITRTSGALGNLVITNAGASYTSNGTNDTLNSLDLQAGTVTANSGQLSIREDFNVDAAATFNHNSGLLVFDAREDQGTYDISGDVTFNDVEFEMDYSAEWSFDTTGTYVVEGELIGEINNSRGGTKATLNSNLSGTQADVDFQTSSTNEDLIIQDINNTGAGTITCVVRCIDGGNVSGNFDVGNAGVSISEVSEAIISETGTTSTFTVRLDKLPTSTVTIGVSSSDTGEATVSPSVLTFTTGNYFTEQTVTITGVDDADDDGGQVVTVSFPTVSSLDTDYDDISLPERTVSVQDDDTDSDAIDFDNAADFSEENVINTGASAITWFEYDWIGMGYLQTGDGGSDVDISSSKIRAGCRLDIDGTEYVVTAVIYDTDGYIRVTTPDEHLRASTEMENLAPTGAVTYIRCTGDNNTTGTLNTGFVNSRKFDDAGQSFFDLYYDPVNDVIWSFDNSDDLTTTNNATGAQTSLSGTSVGSNGSDQGGSIDTTRGYLWWTDYASDEVVAFDGSTGGYAFGTSGASTFSVGDRPGSTAYDSGNDAIWIHANGNTAVITKLDASDGSPVSTTDIGTNQSNFETRGITYDTTNDAIWAVIDNGENILKLDASDGSAFDTDIATSTYDVFTDEGDFINRGLVWHHPSTDRVFTSQAECDFPDPDDTTSDHIVVLDASDGSYIKHIPMGECLYQTYYDPDTEKIYGSSELDGAVVILDPETLEVDYYVAGVEHDGITVDSDGDIWTNDEWDGHLWEWVIDGTVTNERYSVATTDSSQIDTTGETTLSSITIDETLNNQEIMYFISFDDRQSFKEWGSWIEVVSDQNAIHGGVNGDWYYLDAGDVWQAASPNTQEAALSAAAEEGRGTDGTTLSGLSESDLTSAGGFQGGVTTTIDMAATFFSDDAHEQPVVNGASFNFTAASTSGGGSTSVSVSNASLEGNYCHASTLATVTLSGSNISEFLISEHEDFSDASWRTFAPNADGEPVTGEDGRIVHSMQLDFTLSDADGEKTIYVKYRSTSNNESNLMSQNVLLDQAGACVDVIERIEPEPETETAFVQGCLGILQESRDDETLLSYQFGVSPDPSKELSSADLVRPGDQIRSHEFDTVYCIDEQLNRRPYVDETTYFTHHRSFTDVRWVTSEALSAFHVVTPMLPRVGTTLVKFQSSNEVYIYEHGDEIGDRGALTWITTEELAEFLVGEEWADFVIDLNPTLATYFDFSAPLLAPADLDTDEFRKRVLLNEKNANAENRSDIVITKATDKNPKYEAFKQARTLYDGTETLRALMLRQLRLDPEDFGLRPIIEIE